MVLQISIITLNSVHAIRWEDRMSKLEWHNAVGPFCHLYRDGVAVYGHRR